ncbi:MAG: hypothetical protein ONB23_05545 [candidate division KSB1 bacterium]|nr:hypothetical protein [candidate division KSB1 bacterium]
MQISEEARRLLQNEVKHWLSVGRRVEDLANSLADRLLQAGLAKSPEEARSLSEKVAGALAEPTGKSSRPNLAEIQERVRSGYYSSPGIVERIAEKILGELGL